MSLGTAMGIGNITELAFAIAIGGEGAVKDSITCITKGLGSRKLGCFRKERLHFRTIQNKYSPR